MEFLILIALAFAVCFLRPRFAILAMLAAVLYTAQGNQFDVAGFAVFPVRLLGALCFARVVLTRRLASVTWSKFDLLTLLLYASVFVIHMLGPEARADVLGRALDAILVYTSFRSLITSRDDITWCLKALVVLLVPYVLAVAVESRGSTNPFAYIGASNAVWLREGGVRCFGSFRHPSLLGSFGAGIIPLYIGLTFQRQLRSWAIIGATIAAMLVLFAHSGGPVAGALVGLLGWGLWRFRTRMSNFRRALACLIIGLTIFMKAPIWYLPSKLSNLTGGGGWHRARVMEVAFERVHEWWLVGMPRARTSDWLPYRLRSTGSADITNQFVEFGLEAGLGAVLITIWVLTEGFRSVGRSIAAVRSQGDYAAETLIWGLGVGLGVHVANWLGITYFDQITVAFIFHLASIGSVEQSLRAQAMSAHEAAAVETSPVQLAATSGAEWQLQRERWT
jgi:hypothetical protein